MWRLMPCGKMCGGLGGAVNCANSLFHLADGFVSRASTVFCRFRCRRIGLASPLAFNAGFQGADPFVTVQTVTTPEGSTGLSLLSGIMLLFFWRRRSPLQPQPSR
jgi:hypothetical protein